MTQEPALYFRNKPTPCTGSIGFTQHHLHHNAPHFRNTFGPAPSPLLTTHRRPWQILLSQNTQRDADLTRRGCETITYTEEIGTSDDYTTRVRKTTSSVTHPTPQLVTYCPEVQPKPIIAHHDNSTDHIIHYPPYTLISHLLFRSPAKAY